MVRKFLSGLFLWSLTNAVSSLQHHTPAPKTTEAAPTSASLKETAHLAAPVPCTWCYCRTCCTVEVKKKTAHKQSHTQPHSTVWRSYLVRKNELCASCHTLRSVFHNAQLCWCSRFIYRRWHSVVDAFLTCTKTILGSDDKEMFQF